MSARSGIESSPKVKISGENRDSADLPEFALNISVIPLRRYRHYHVRVLWSTLTGVQLGWRPVKS